MEKQVTFTRAHDIVTLAINRPKDKNMLSDEAVDLMITHIIELDQDDSVRVVIIRGEEKEFFCGGLFNPRQMSELSPKQIWLRRRRGNELFDLLEGLIHPVIGAINGRAQAGGFELALACDMRVAAAHASFAMPENKWGMFPGAGGPIRLPRIVGVGKAMEIIMTGRDINAEEALSIGLVERIVPSDKFEDEVGKLAELISSTAPLGNRAVKKLIRASIDLGMKEARAYSDALREPLATSADTAEGIASFVEGRTPHYRGR